MKKKNLKNLALHTYRIANLSSLQVIKGGTATVETATVETETQVDTYPSLPNSVAATNCNTHILECASLNFDDCATNGSTTRTPPPTEYNSCTCNALGING